MAQREGSGASAAAAAAEQVRAIVEAAERSAASIEAAAREDAAAIRAEAETDASAAREAAGRLAERADELERRLDELADGVRAAVAGLKEDLAKLRAGAARPGTPEPASASTGEAEPDVDPTIAETEAVAAREPEVADPGEEPAGAEAEPAEREAAEREAATEQPTTRTTAPEGARVLALKMALDGTPREETARYLRENFELEDPDGLLDEVYARAGG
jgi:hypothetical protein